MSGVILLMTSPIDRPVSLRRGPLLTLAVLLAALFVSGGAGAAEQTAKSFNLSAGTAAKALRRFTEQSGIPVLFGTETAAQVRTNAVQGEFTPTEAMARLLANTGLVVTANEKTGALTVSRDPNAQRAAPVAADSRPSAPSGANVRPAASDSETVILSPFTVSTDKDSGYAATETLAGTRMRTNLRDVGASLTVLTPEFLQDLGVNSFEQALLYTASVDSTEGDNTDANRASGTQLRFGTGQSYSIRGFNSNAGNQSISHDFFPALEATDVYNLERITLALGPNALLIGVGNPQGTAVTTTKRAQVQRRKTTVEVQVDRWTSRRVALDHNQPLIRDKLAMRFNVLHDEHREFRDYEGKDQKRITLGLTAKPFARTTITVNHESYSLHTNASSLMWGFNGNVLRWLAAGKPTVNFVSGGLTWATNRPYVDANGSRVPVAAGVVSTDGFIRSRNDFDPNAALAILGSMAQTWIVGLPLTNPMVNLRYQGTLERATFSGITSANYQSVNPWQMLGLPQDANLNGGTWDDPSSREQGRWTQFMVEQKLAEGLYLELASNVAKRDRQFSPDNFTTLEIDPNRYLPNGSLNPGYLVPFNENAAGQYNEQFDHSDAYRATLSYQLNLTTLNRWLGQHNLSGLYQSIRDTSNQDRMRVMNLATVGRAGAGWSPDTINAASTLRRRTYFVDGNVPVFPDQIQVIKNMAQLNSYGRLVGATSNEAAPLDLALRPFLAAAQSGSENDSLSLGWMARWLQDRLVTVAGYRRDATKSYNAPILREMIDPAVPGGVTNPLSRFYELSRNIPLNKVPAVTSTGITRTYGAVYHTPLPGLSLTYNRSSNFLPNTNASAMNPLGEALPNASGQTEDFGLRLSFLRDRLSLSLNRFKTSANNQTQNANGYLAGAIGIMRLLRSNYQTVGDSHFVAMASSYPLEVGGAADVWNYAARGYEMSATFNPSRNWRLALTGSDNTNMLGHYLDGVGRYLGAKAKYEGLETWSNFANELNKVAAGQRSAFFDLDPASSAARTQAAADARSIANNVTTQQTRYENAMALQGVTTARNGKYAINGLVTRVFHEGRLKGWSVGGNFRWRSPNTIGYEQFTDSSGLPNNVINVAKSLQGDDYWDLGAMIAHKRRVSKSVDLKVQLNIQNLPNWQAPRLVSAGYDNLGVNGTVNAIVPTLWELRRPRSLILTTTFDF